jgi:transposase
MEQITMIGLDLAKHVFQLHGVSASGTVLLRKAVRRGQLLAFFSGLPPCTVAMEACPTAHHWARELVTLGHEVRLMPPKYVKAYVKRNKNDAADAEAICEAAGRPNMRFVPVKSREQQAALMLHRARNLLVRHRTMLSNAIRGHMAEFGIIEAQGAHRVKGLLEVIEDDADARLPALARGILRLMAAQLNDLAARIGAIERQIMLWHKASARSRLLDTIPGIGPIIATAITAAVPDASAFKSGRQFAAWLGLVPRQNSSGGKARLGGISKQGNTYLRRQLIVGAHSVLRWSKEARQDPWIGRLLARKPRLVVAVALANKLARIAWAVMVRGEEYRRPATA